MYYANFIILVSHEDVHFTLLVLDRLFISPLMCKQLVFLPDFVLLLVLLFSIIFIIKETINKISSTQGTFFSQPRVEVGTYELGKIMLVFSHRLRKKTIILMRPLALCLPNKQ